MTTRLVTIVKPEDELALWHGDIKPGLVPRGFAESILSKIEPVENVGFLWDSAAQLAGYAQKWNGHGAEKAEIKAAQMFCEIQIGQLLGPNPGHGPGRGHKDCHGNVLPPPAVAVFRRYYGWRDALVEAVREGALSRRSLLLLVDQWLAGEGAPTTIEQLDIRRGDFRDVLADIEPNSVSLILTDPPYPEKYLPLWDDLGAFAAERLVDGGSLIAYCGQSILPDVLQLLSGHLRYWWTLALIHGKSQMLPGKFVSAGWKPIVWFVKGGRNRAERPGEQAGDDCAGARSRLRHRGRAPGRRLRAAAAGGGRGTG